MDEVKIMLSEELSGTSLQSLSENIPGGMFTCRFDRELTLMQMNQGFLSMLGYSRQDITELFHDSFWNMIDPRDRTETLREVHRQMKISDSKELEYRILCRDGRSMWVLDKGRLIRDENGDAYFCCVLVDVTTSKELEEKLRMLLERQQVIIEQATDIIFEWDFLADTLEFSSNWEKKFGKLPNTRNVSLYLEHAPYIYSGDQAAFAAMMERIRRGARSEETEVRIMDVEENYRWCRICMTDLFDESGRAVRAIGTIMDIDAEKRRAESLMERAQRDGLTGLYNKIACREHIEAGLEQLAPEQKAALMVIDLDNFKNINDTMGHLFGDALLSEISHTLQKQFRSIDVVGRVGGDEFLVFLSQIPSGALAEKKAEQILKAIGGMAVGELTNMDLSCSVGIAVYPGCGKTYQELFQAADQALYQAKKQGKKQFCMSSPETALNGMPAAGESAVNARIDSNEIQETVGPRLVEYVFHILYKTHDMEAAVNSILEAVGRQYDVSRVYIFEDEEDGSCCNNTFEWCGEGVEPQIGNLQNISYVEDISGYHGNFNEQGVFYCRDISELEESQYRILNQQGIKSVLQCAIYDNGQYKGFVGFDECRMNRYWTQEQVNGLIFISEILSTFLTKWRAQEKAVSSARAMEKILDRLSAWVYVIDPETFSLLYINRKTRELVQGVQTGMACHEAFFYKDSPCAFCPVIECREGMPCSGRQIYNPYLNVWTSVDVTHLEWNGKDSVLVTCFDITELKNKLDSLEKERESWNDSRNPLDMP